MRDQLYERLAPEWRATLASGAFMEETDHGFYGRFHGWNTRTTMADIGREVAAHFDTSMEAIRGGSRTVKSMRPRWVLAYLIFDTLPSWNQSDVARFMKRDHTTIHHMRKTAEGIAARGEAWFAKACEAVRKRL